MQMKMIDDRVNYKKCAWYHGYREHTVCGYYGYDVCDCDQARDCQMYTRIESKGRR